MFRPMISWSVSARSMIPAVTRSWTGISTLRWTQDNALDHGKVAYGENCETPFSSNIFDLNGTSSFYCSKLVYRIFMDNNLHSANLNSNAFQYYYWLEQKHTLLWATLAIGFTVSPDEVALDPDLSSSYEESIP